MSFLTTILIYFFGECNRKYRFDIFHKKKDIFYCYYQRFDSKIQLMRGTSLLLSTIGICVIGNLFLNFNIK